LKNLLIVTRSFYPGVKSGGPVRSITNLLNILPDTIDANIITLDRDLGDSKHYDDINVNSWGNLYGKFKVFYMDPLFNFYNLFSYLKTSFYDIVYLNSFFDYFFTIRFVLLHKFGLLKSDSLVLAPRGELTFGAMSLKKNKKIIYLSIFKLFGLHKKICFHFTSDIEKDESLFYLGNVKYIVAPNMHEKIVDYKLKYKNKNQLNLLFLSRISAKKNLLVALKALDFDFKGIINFEIAGNIEDHKYWEQCQKIISKLPKNVNVSYLGSLDRDGVVSAFGTSHAFILPTLNENYGHAIVEAMISSNNVILSQNTPWNEVSKYGGFVVYDDDDCVEQYRNCIQNLLAMDSLQFNDSTKLVYDYCYIELMKNETSAKSIFDINKLQD
jgi:glycosyltransferase involved in cell wall biosynthesis